MIIITFLTLLVMSESKRKLHINNSKAFSFGFLRNIMKILIIIFADELYIMQDDDAYNIHGHLIV